MKSLYIILLVLLSCASVHAQVSGLRNIADANDPVMKAWIGFVVTSSESTLTDKQGKVEEYERDSRYYVFNYKKVPEKGIYRDTANGFVYVFVDRERTSIVKAKQSGRQR